MKKTDLLKPGGERHTQLVELSREINHRENSIAMLHDGTIKEADKWKCEVMLQGQALSRVKAMLTFGMWSNWLQNNCPLISARTAQRYMWVAHNADRPGMNEVTSLRTALALRSSDARSDPGAAREPKRFPAGHEFVEKVARLEATLNKHDVSEWPAEWREKILVHLAAIVQRFTVGPNGPSGRAIRP